MRFTRQPQYPARIDDSNILAQGLKMLYPLGGGWGLLDATGNTTGTVTAGPLGSFTAPQIGGLATTFNGTSQYITTNWAGILGSGAVTVSCWFRTSVAATCPIVSWGTNTTGNAFQVSVESGVIWGRFSSVTCSFGSGFNDGNWHRLVFIKPAGVSSAGCRVYIDGKSIALASSSGTATISPTASYNVRIGVFLGTPAAWFNGQLAEIQINASQWGADQVKAFQRNPWQIFQFPKKRVLEALSGTAVNLTGSETQKQQTAGTISIQVPLTGASIQRQHNSGTVSVGVASMTGQSTVRQKMDGSIQVQAVLSATDIQKQLTSGSLSINVTLAGNVIQKEVMSGTLTNNPAGAVNLSGEMIQRQRGGGSLEVAQSLTGGSVTVQKMSGSISAIATLSGVSVTAQRMFGGLTASVNLQGTDLQKAFMQAGLTPEVFLTATEKQKERMSGILSVSGGGNTVNLAGQMNQKQEEVGTVTISVNLSAAALQHAVMNGYLTLGGILEASPEYTVCALGRSFEVHAIGRSFEI